MIDKLNIPLQNKDTKKIKYWLYLDDAFWLKYEYNNEGYIIHYVNSGGYWIKKGYNTRGERTYFEDSKGNIIDDRKN